MDPDSDDDFFNPAPPAQGSRADPLVDQEYARMEQRYTDAGYREGITDGKLSTLQAGFDASFAASVPLSRAVGTLRGRATALLHFVEALTAAAGPMARGRSPPEHATDGAESLADDVRALLAALARLRRDAVLPVDLERIAHEREAHGADGHGDGGGAGSGGEGGEGSGGGYELDLTAGREMQALLDGIEGLGAGAGLCAGLGAGGAGGAGETGSAGAGRETGQALVGWLETALASLETRAHALADRR
ncbi:hypothetical protein Q5752_006701 [Cryptotrichosporon argae]